MNKQSMPKTNKIITVPSERIENKVFLIRGKKMMIDRDLAELYGVETRVLNCEKMGPRKSPLVFTEPGVAMLHTADCPRTRKIYKFVIPAKQAV